MQFHYGSKAAGVLFLAPRLHHENSLSLPNRHRKKPHWFHGRSHPPPPLLTVVPGAFSFSSPPFKSFTAAPRTFSSASHTQASKGFAVVSALSQAPHPTPTHKKASQCFRRRSLSFSLSTTPQHNSSTGVLFLKPPPPQRPTSESLAPRTET